MKVHYQSENVTITLVDTSSNTERNQRLEEPLKRFFKEVEREKNEKSTKKGNPNRTRASSYS